MNNPIKRLGGEDILNEEDLVDFSKAEKSIYQLMQDGAWYSATSIIESSGQREGLRRLRNFRSKGYEVERKRISSQREFYYRLVQAESPELEQGKLFE